MHIIKKPDGKILLTEHANKVGDYEALPNYEIEFDTIEDVKMFIENANAKFERFSKGAPGYENRAWFGMYASITMEVKEEAVKIAEKYKKLMDIEMMALEGHTRGPKVLVFDVEASDQYPETCNLFEIGAVVLDLKTGMMAEAFNYVISSEFHPDKHETCWIYDHSDLTPAKIQAGVSLEDVRQIIQTYFNSYSVVSYNKNYDFTVMSKRRFKFPKNREWDPADPMLVATDVLKISNYYGFKWPKVQECLDYFKIDETEPHRAFEDSKLEARIIHELYKLKVYDVPEK